MLSFAFIVCFGVFFSLVLLDFIITRKKVVYGFLLTKPKFYLIITAIMFFCLWGDLLFMTREYIFSQLNYDRTVIHEKIKTLKQHQINLDNGKIHHTTYMYINNHLSGEIINNMQTIDRLDSYQINYGHLKPGMYD